MEDNRSLYKKLISLSLSVFGHLRYKSSSAGYLPVFLKALREPVISRLSKHGKANMIMKDGTGTSHANADEQTLKQIT